MRIVLFSIALSLSLVGALQAQKANNGEVLRVVLSYPGGKTTVNGKVVPNHKGASEYFETFSRPGYPFEARKVHASGNGIFRIFVNRPGKVTRVDVLVSTGYAVLDNESVRTLLAWQGKPGPLRQIDVPISFVLTIGP
jgi:TonB family protein